MTNNWTYSDWKDVSNLICHQLGQWMPHAQIAQELKDLFSKCNDEPEFFEKARALTESHYKRWSALN